MCQLFLEIFSKISKIFSDYEQFPLETVFFQVLIRPYQLLIWTKYRPLSPLTANYRDKAPFSRLL